MERAEPIVLKSSSFQDGREIPSIYTCEGEDKSPPLEWTAPPAGTRSFVLIVDDPDAPDGPNGSAPKFTWVHWIVYNLPEETRRLEEAVPTLPNGAREGVNDWKRAHYGGPCPPVGRHRYFFKLYALDKVLPELLPLPNKPVIEEAMQGHILAAAELVGTYEKKKRR